MASAGASSRRFLKKFEWNLSTFFQLFVKMTFGNEKEVVWTWRWGNFGRKGEPWK